MEAGFNPAIRAAGLVVSHCARGARLDAAFAGSAAGPLETEAEAGGDGQAEPGDGSGGLSLGHPLFARTFWMKHFCCVKGF